jgi:hypothetical protein
MQIQNISRAEEWVVARRALVEELTRLRSQLYADPCALPRRHEAPDDGVETADLPLALLSGASDHAARGWTRLLDRLEG